MFVHCPNDWLEFIECHIEKNDILELQNTIESQYGNAVCFPPKDQIFQAFKYCATHQIKVIILGQDPYHGPHQANGLAFSVPFGVKHPPSLKNIFIELSQDQDIGYPFSGSLEPWASQGVLLLNTALSVEMSKPASHLKYWKPFTKKLLSAISKEKEFVIFVLWGGFAQKFERCIDTDKHVIIKGGHPSPLSANKGHWFGNRHFSKINELLKQKKEVPINWDVDRPIKT